MLWIKEINQIDIRLFMPKDNGVDIFMTLKKRKWEQRFL